MFHCVYGADSGEVTSVEGLLFEVLPEELQGSCVSQSVIL